MIVAPHYPHARIRSLASLRHPLGMEIAGLQSLAKRASHMYFVAQRVPKDDGSFRVLYDTRQPLKEVLKRINEEFMRKVRFPAHLTGGLLGTDYKSAVDIHLGAATVVQEDIRQFFPNVSTRVVHGIWSRFFGFSDDVAELLTLLTTRHGHLEQGAPTSSYLANLALWDVEPRVIARLADLGFTRYSRHIDDVCVSSDTVLGNGAIAEAVSQIHTMLQQKSLHLKRSKHNVTQPGSKVTILGLIGNAKASLPPSERSRVRAMVHQFCQRAEASTEIAALLAELPRMRGHAYKVKRFHPTEGATLVEKIDAVAARLALLPVQVPAAST